MPENNTTNQKCKMGVERNSIEKVYEVLKNTRTALTTSQISEQTTIHFSSVKSALEFLSNLNKVILMTNGKITLAKINLEENQNAR